jgi:glycine oxidase
VRRLARRPAGEVYCCSVPEAAIVIGGGVMGLASARELRRRGWAVRLLERAQPGRAASWASAGIIGATTRDESDPGYELRRLSRALWPAFAEALLAESGLDPEYREIGCLYLAGDEAELAWLRRVAARDSTSPADASSRADAQAEFLDDQAVHTAEPALGPAIPGGLYLSGGNVEPRRLCRALEIAVRRAGVEIHTGLTVEALSSRGGRISGVETTDGELFEADAVVLAAGAWSAGIRGLQPLVPVHPQRGQILALDQTRVGVRHVLLTAGDPYFVPRCDGRLVIGATREEAGWDASLTAGGIAWLLNRAMQVVPALAECAIAELWTGFRPLSVDGLPLIGPGELDGLYLLTGHGPSGISPMPGSVALLMALMHHEAPPIEPAPFNPLRFAAARGSSYR